jgi:hypothetical protein
MRGDPDDEALRWDGDDDPTLAPGWKRVGGPAERPPEAEGDDRGPDAAASDRPVEKTDDEADAAAQPGSAELVLLGVFAGVYLLYSIGWILTATGFGAVGADDPVSSFMFTVGLWLAVLAPTLWYVIAFASTKGRPRARLIWMLLGVIVLVPLPFVMGVNA